jgi:hypothetical protein
VTSRAALVLSIQGAQALLTLAFGAAALRVCARPSDGGRSCAWYLAGVTFATSGALATLLNVVAVAGVAAGPRSSAYALSVRLQPPGNDGRGFAVLGFAVAFALLCAGRGGALTRRRVAAWVGIPLAVGVVVGAIEGAFQIDKQYTMLSVVSGATVVVLFAALYAALVRNSVDWYLWIALALYSVREALNSIIEAARAAGYISKEWMPDQASILWLGAASMVVMLACTLLRLGVLRTGREPPALLERLGA